LGLSFTTDKQKEAAWRMEFEALGEQSVLKNVKQGESYNAAKRQAAFRWLSEQAQLRDRRETRTADLACTDNRRRRRIHCGAPQRKVHKSDFCKP
jgi:hypothetical protein